MTGNQFLQGRVAMVTGGTKGMGKAMALAFASAGADIAIGSRAAATSPCKAELEALGVRVLAINVDVRSTESVQHFYETVVKTFGKVDILANSAGIQSTHTMCDHPDELWLRVIDINLNGVYRTIKLCLPGMIERQWGRIINIASTAALVGSPEYAAYCASKAAVVGLTRCVALEGAPHGVTCNAISPGWVETEGAQIEFKKLARAEGKSTAEYIEQIKQEHPQKRIIQPEEIAGLALFLCLDYAKAITMQNLTVSGGSLW
jgi:NAD(P)-dependent dehydrogenase (short-subunit alcohol dehydrogenase family)